MGKQSKGSAGPCPPPNFRDLVTIAVQVGKYTVDHSLSGVARRSRRGNVISNRNR